MNWRLWPWDYLTRTAGLAGGVMFVAFGTARHGWLLLTFGGVTGMLAASALKANISREVARRKARRP